MTRRTFGVRNHHRFSLTLVGILTACVFLPAIGAASAVDAITVHCPDESLQAAIDSAPAGAVIDVQGICIGNVTIDRSITIDGGSSAVLDGDGSGSVVVVRGTDVKLSHLNITGGVASGGSGGGLLIAVGASADLVDVDLVGNRARYGGAIRVQRDGQLVGSSLELQDNSAVEGGAISVAGGTVELSSSDLIGNRAAIAGGAIALRNGATFHGVEVTIDGNSAGANGGGILANKSTVELVDSTISNNVATDGGGIANTAGASSTLLGTQVARNTAEHFGGGAFNAGSDIWIVQSTIASNAASARGGGVANIRGTNNGRVFVTNSTLARNNAPRGSAIDNSDVFVALDHATITENTGSAAFWESRPPPWTAPVNSIIAENQDGDCSSPLLTGGGNVVGDCALVDLNGDPAPRPTDLLDVDPLVEPAANSLSVLYYGPRPHSPIIDLIPVADCTQTVDQNGATRPSGPGCDPGSRERGFSTSPRIDADFEFGHAFPSGSIVLSGWATDDEGVTNVNVGIKDRNRNRWLQDDMATWLYFNTIPAELAAPGETHTTWSISLDLPNGDYALAANVRTADRSYAEIVPYRHFTIGPDSTAPVVNADFPAGTEFTNPVLLSGTATDGTAVERMKLAVRDRVTKLWLQSDEVSWGTAYHGFIPSTAVGLGTPEVVWTLGLSLPEGIYSLAARARDWAGNWGEMAPWRGFSVASPPAPLFVDSGQSHGSDQTMRIGMGDFDGDDDVDVFAANGVDSPNRVWINDGAAGFSDSGQRLGASWSWGVAIGDVDDDGDLDAFVANYAYGQPNMVWLNDGSGEFTDSGQRLGERWSLSVALADLDGNDSLDAFVGSYQPNSVWLNGGDGIFEDSGQELDPWINATVALGDLDDDGDLDAFVANHGWSDPAPNHVLFNDGSGLFTDSGQHLGWRTSLGVALADLDGDGDLDAFTANHGANVVWINDGSGDFADSAQRLGNQDSISVALGDIDDDGDADAFVGNIGGDRIWLNDGSGSFFSGGLLLGSLNAVDVALADLDGDGDLDAWVGNDGGNEVWLNTTK